MPTLRVSQKEKGANKNRRARRDRRVLGEAETRLLDGEHLEIPVKTYVRTRTTEMYP